MDAAGDSDGAWLALAQGLGGARDFYRQRVCSISQVGLEAGVLQGLRKVRLSL